MNAFHAYDIRGVYNVDFNKEDVYKIGYFLPQLLQTNKVLIGRDVRSSSPEIFEALVNGIIDSGTDVYSIGLATTPMVYYGTAHYGFGASVQITASHNPKEYNGLKISRINALPVGYDSGLKELEEMMNNITPTVNIPQGKVIEWDIKNEYLKFLKTYKRDTSNLKIAIDCSNGMAALLIKDLFDNQPVYIFDELDGTFPNHEANPLIAENIVVLQETVKSQKCDIGAIFDGDGDRVMFVDENGKFISPDLIIAVISHFFKGQKGKVLQDIRTSKAVYEYISKSGFEMEMWRVGRAYAAHKLREIDGIFGGELAGHYYFRDFFYSDSGLLALLIVLNVFSEMKKTGKTVSQLISEIAKYENSGEINFKIKNKKEAMEKLRTFFTENEKSTAFYDFDGYRIEFENWWFNVRPSNTEPYLRLLVEATSTELLAEKVNTMKNLLQEFV